MGFALGLLGGIGSIATAVGAAGNKVGQIQGNDMPVYKGPDPNSYQYGGEGLDFFRQGLGQQMNQDKGTLANQNALVAQLQQQAAGNGPSAAQGVLNQGRDAAIAQSQAAAGAARGNGLGGAQLNAANAGTAATMGAANQATMLRAQEQQQATQNLGQVLGGMREQYGQDALRRDKMEQFYMSLGQTREQAALSARAQMESEAGQAYRDYEANRLGVAKHNSALAAGQVAGIGKAFSSLGAAGGSMGGGGGGGGGDAGGGGGDAGGGGGAGGGMGA